MDFATIKLITEITSAVLILLGFELFNRKHLKAFHIMAIGQFLAMVVSIYANLWFLAFMHLVNSLLQIRGYMKWQRGGMRES